MLVIKLEKKKEVKEIWESNTLCDHDWILVEKGNKQRKMCNIYLASNWGNNMSRRVVNIIN